MTIKTIVQGVIVVLCVLVGTTATARTWRLAPDGSGDIPHLRAGMDSALVGDTILVAPGEYVIEAVPVANGVILIGEAGALRTKFRPFVSPGYVAGLSCTMLQDVVTISGIWFDGFAAGGSVELGAINIVQSGPTVIRNCIFSNNDLAGISMLTFNEVFVEQCTFADNVLALHVASGGGYLTSNILWSEIDRLSLSFLAYCNDVLDLQDIPAALQFANFSSDPMFCGPADYRIAPDSPCAPGQSPLGSSCDLIGALPADCTTNPVESRTWGGVKALYRER